MNNMNFNLLNFFNQQSLPQKKKGKRSMNMSKFTQRAQYISFRN